MVRLVKCYGPSASLTTRNPVQKAHWQDYGCRLLISVAAASFLDLPFDVVQKRVS